jgi:hypothetical protein
MLRLDAASIAACLILLRGLAAVRSATSCADAIVVSAARRLTIWTPFIATTQNSETQ